MTSTQQREELQSKIWKIEGGDDSIDYETLPDSVITPAIKDDAVKTKGYFIYPSQLFANELRTDIDKIVAELEEDDHE